MSKIIKDDKQKAPQKIYQSTSITKKEIVPSGNIIKITNQRDKRNQDQNNHRSLLKNEQNHNQRDISKNNKTEKIVTTISSRRNIQENETKKNSMNKTSNNNNKKEEHIVVISRRNNSNRVSETKNENINLNNLKNIQKNENRNKYTNSVSKNNSNTQNPPIVIINKRQSNTSTENEKRSQPQRPLSQSRPQIQNIKDQFKYQSGNHQLSQDKNAQKSNQFQYISKYNSNTTKITKNQNTPIYKTNTTNIAQRKNIKDIPKPPERKYVRPTIDLKNKPDTSIEHKSGHTEIYISKANKSNSNSKNDKNKNENKNKILTKQNTSTSLRPIITLNIAQKYNNSTVRNNQNQNQNKSSVSVPKRASTDNNLKSNNQIHTISQIENKKDKPSEKIDLNVRKTKIAISQNRYKNSKNNVTKEMSDIIPNLNQNIVFINDSKNKKDNKKVNEPKNNDKNNRNNNSNIIRH